MLLPIIGGAIVLTGFACAPPVPPRGPRRAGAGAVPPDLARLVLPLSSCTAPAAEVRAAAQQAAAQGFTLLAQTLNQRADTLEAAQALASGPPGARRSSPLDGVADAAWGEYVRRMTVAHPASVSQSFRLGQYAFDGRELADAGWMTQVRKGRWRGRDGVWLGTWASGRSFEAFLRDPEQQYDALVELTRRHAGEIRARYGGRFGAVLEGQPVSLSGLLAVARKARLSGLRKWVDDPADRAQWSDTTALYRRFAGIF
jgi:hypothetical protein